MINRSVMSTDESKPTKSRNPENFTFLDKESLSRFTTDTGKILPRKYTGLTPMQQRKISKLIKKSRHMQLFL
jgi:small subunit ribosomal protein S18